MKSKRTLSDFHPGDDVIHLLSKDYLVVTKIGNEEVECRCKDLEKRYFYPWELDFRNNDDDYDRGYNRNGYRNGGGNGYRNNRW